MIRALQMLVLSGRDCKSRPARTYLSARVKREHPDQRGNTFKVPDSRIHYVNGNAVWTYGYGIWAHSNFNATITDNIFKHTGSAIELGNWGIIQTGYPITLNNGGLIKRNVFNDVYVGTQIELNNPYTKITCNTYTNQDREWFINPQHHGYFLGPQGTGCVEGTSRAGNIFNDSGEHIWNYAQQFQYYAAGGVNANTIPYYSTNANFVDIENCGYAQPDSNSCDISGGGGHLVISDEKALKAELDAELLILKNEYDSVESILDNNLTDTLMAHISNSSYSNATLTNELVSNSLLSDEVLIAASNRSPFFSYNQYLSIILNNSPVSNTVWEEVKEVYYESSNPPDTLIDAQKTDTSRTLTVINREMDILKTDLFLTEYNIVSLYAEADSIPLLRLFLSYSYY